MRKPCFNHGSQDNPKLAKWYNCRYEEEPQTIADSATNHLLQNICPELFEDNNLDIPVCCNKDQIEILDNDLKKAEAIIGGCPSCYFNFRNMWCHMTCSPKQSDFVVIKKTEMHPFQNYSIFMEEHATKGTENEEDKNEDENNGDKKESDSVNEKSIEEEEEKDPKVEMDEMVSENKEVEVVSEINYFINRNFVQEMINSCK